VDCITKVAESKDRLKNLSFDLLPKAEKPKDARAKMIASGKDDILLFTEAALAPPTKLRVTTAKPPSDVLWENLHFRKKTMWKRKTRSAAIIALVLLISLAVIGAAMAANNSLSPFAQCADIGVGGEFLDCPAVWDLGSTSEASPGARTDIEPFITQTSVSVDVFACKGHISFDEWRADVGDLSGFFTATENATAAAVFRLEYTAGTATAWAGGLVTNSNVDECAAHVCYTCYCKGKGFGAYYESKDGLQDFCKQY
jgi:hypothetical protein